MQKKNTNDNRHFTEGPISSFKHAKTNYSTSVFFDLIKSSDIAKIYTRKNNFTSTRNQSRDTSVRSVTAKRFDEKERDQIDLTIWSMQGRTQREPKSQAPKAQCTAGNWTKLNSTERFSSVQFPAVNWTGDDLQRFGDEIGGRRRFFTIATHLWIGQSTQCLSLDENWRRAATTGDGRRRFVDGRRRFLTVKNLWRPSPVVAGSIHSGKLNWTQLNDPVQFSSVEFTRGEDWGKYGVRTFFFHRCIFFAYLMSQALWTLCKVLQQLTCVQGTFDKLQYTFQCK